MSRKSYLEDEFINTAPVEIIEEFLDIPEEKIGKEKENQLVRFDMNMVEYPIFSKNKHRKENQIVKYYFNQKKDKYIEVRPASGSYIPGDFEEKVFIALTKLMRDRKYGNEFVVSVSEIIENLNIENTNTKRGIAKRIKEAIIRLTQTSYTFKNTLYSNKENKILEDTIVTNIMTVRIITRKDKVSKNVDHFSDGRIKEVYKISLSKPFYENLLRKGYLVYNSELLLEIDNAVARAIYMLLNKWRFNRLYLIEKIVYLMKRIPLKYDKGKLGRSVKIIENSCLILKNMNLIDNFNIIKDSTWEEATIEFFFKEFHNDIKQENFYEDRNTFSNLQISYTEEKNILDTNILIEITPSMIEEIFNLLPRKARQLSTMSKTIKDSIEKYGIERTKSSAIYTKKQKATKIRSYFLKTLENNWDKDTEINFIKQQKLEIVENNEDIIEKDKLYEEFLNLNIIEQEEIENKVYDNYIGKCGMEGKAQKIAFKAGKSSLIKDYLYENKDILNKNNIEKIDINFDLIRKKIDEQLNFYFKFLKFTDKEILDIELEVGRITFEKYSTGNFQEKEISEIIKTAIKNIKN
ncbi:hypothetical protein [Cetobacterium sp. SF1]|uniref:hypothetical protein n=1 Tax=unclassified Cetobacterium TaxID=2630983 RepID=UPI003CF19CD2